MAAFRLKKGAVRLANKVETVFGEKPVVSVVQWQPQMPTAILIRHELALEARHEAFDFAALAEEAEFQSAAFRQITRPRDALSRAGSILGRGGIRSPRVVAEILHNDASTWLACSSGFTLGQIFLILPSGPIRKVIRRKPRNVFPRKVFSPQTP